METLAEYLAGYLGQEFNQKPNPKNIPFSTSENELREWIEQGIDAFQSTENCTVVTIRK